MRERQAQIIGNFEEIIEYSYFAGGMIRAVIATGTEIDGKFVPDENQNFQVAEFVGPAFEDIMKAKGNKPAGVFRVEDIWQKLDEIKDQAKPKALKPRE